MYQYLRLPVSEIFLDQNNPRFSPVSSQRDAIEAMLEEQGEKIYQLAEDIAKYGLDPSKRLIVFIENERYIDGDGNRRLTVLKILETPDLIRGHRSFKKYQNLSKDFNVPIDVDCVVYSSRDEIRHWLEIKSFG